MASRSVKFLSLLSYIWLLPHWKLSDCSIKPVKTLYQTSFVENGFLLCQYKNLEITLKMQSPVETFVSRGVCKQCSYYAYPGLWSVLKLKTSILYVRTLGCCWWGLLILYFRCRFNRLNIIIGLYWGHYTLVSIL